ncbi:MAG: OmpA family protein [Bacteroidota bacterium]
MHYFKHKSILRCAIRLAVAVLLLTWVTGTVRAQSSRWLQKGEAAFSEQSYPEAIQYFEWAHKKKAGIAALEGLGKCHWALKRYSEAEKWYRLASETAGSPAINYFYWGRCLMANEKYTAASDAFKKCAQLLPPTQSADYLSLLNLIQGLKRDSSDFEIQPLPFNSPVSDFSPMWFGDGLAFTSARRNEAGIATISNVDGSRLTDLWYVAQNPAGDWQKPRPIKALNSRINEGPLTIDSTRKILYFTRNDPGMLRSRDRNQRLNKLRIYTALWGEETGWTGGDPLPFSTGEHAVGHPALGPDGQHLYFAAELPGGDGGTDLWRVTLSGDQWTAPVHLDAPINTAGDELFPYLGKDGTLYFASDGHLGLGGLDLFMARPDGSGGFLPPVNMGYPLNTHADDLGYVTRDRGRTGYFSSNRGGDPTDDNIYAFRQLRPRFACIPQQENNYCFRFTDAGGLEMESDTVSLLHEWNFGKGDRIIGDSANYCFPGPGTYIVELNLVDTISGFVFLNEATYEVAVTDIEQIYIDGPDTVIVGENVVFDGFRSQIPGCKINEFYWEISDGTKFKGDSIRLSFSDEGQYRISLGAAGDSANTSLRCLNCVYRDITVLSETQMRAVQDSLRAAAATEMKRRRNDPRYQDSLRAAQRRVAMVQQLRDSADQVFRLELLRSRERIDPKSLDFKNYPIREFDLRGDYSYTVGEADDPLQLYPLFREAVDEGFEDAIVVAMVEESESGVDTIKGVALPAERTERGITLFKGTVVDSQGNPLAAEINLEDLEKGIRLVRSKADDEGKFRLELPNGKLYGYYLDLPDYYPVSNRIDLREVDTSAGKPLIIVNEEIKMMTVREIFEQGLAVRINNVFFDFDRDELRPESRYELDRLARILLENPNLNVEIMGHTDDVGNDAYNLDLSRRRARSVMRYLVLSGYPVDKITYAGYGERQPLVENDSPEGQQLNRRVEFRFLPEKRN